VRIRRSTGLAALLVLAFILTTVGGLSAARPALASRDQVAIIQDPRILSEPSYYLSTFRALGATRLRLFMFWDSVAPSPVATQMPDGFDPQDPNSYPDGGWAPYDQIIRQADSLGMTVDLTVSGGAPRWAEGPGIPHQGSDPYFSWRPNARLYGDFMRAVAQRYSGSFTPTGASAPLPAIHFWTVWNEPNFGQDLAPEATRGSRVPYAPTAYRNLVDNAWTALHQTGHGTDTIVIGGFAPEGLVHKPSRKYPGGLPGNYGQMKPLKFVRALYCVNTSYRPLRGRTAAAWGCPTTSAGRRRFRSRNPALFAASGVADHPYSWNMSPLGRKHLDPNYAVFAQLGNLERVLDRVNRAYGSRRRFPIYNDEYGYITRPPQTGNYVTPATAAYYLNWSEYLSWRNPRVVSYAQYLLSDPATASATTAGFASGLLTSSDQPKAVLNAFRLPVYMPGRRLRRGRPAQVWGDLRPAYFMSLDSGAPQMVRIQFQAHDRGPFVDLGTVAVTNPAGYFDTRIHFPASGHVRLAYTYPSGDSLLPTGLNGEQITSRLIQINVR
jgi:hypothetical protein